MDKNQGQSICPCCGQVVDNTSSVGAIACFPEDGIFLGREQRHEASFTVKTDAGEGFTRNISSTGVFFDLKADLKLGEKLSMVIEMQVFSRQMLWICEAVVVRRQLREGNPSYGAKIIEQRLVDKP